MISHLGSSPVVLRLPPLPTLEVRDSVPVLLRAAVASELCRE